MYKPKGVIAALATPMNADESINYEELANQVRRMIESGIHGVLSLGTCGEFYALTFDEKTAVMRTVWEAADKRVPVLAGVGCVTTAETVQLAECAQSCGADALSVITPYFARVSQDMLVEHYKAVASSVDLPVILYNIPARTGNSISPKTLEKLAGIKNIAGIKDSSGDFDNTLQYLEVTGRDFPVLSGTDSLVLATLTAGGAGAIAGGANIFPGKLASIYDLFIAGDISEATKIQDGMREICRCIGLGNPNSIVKRAACLLGHDLGPTRRPFNVDSSEYDNVILEAFERYYRNWD